jgi:hypothetical protein
MRRLLLSFVTVGATTLVLPLAAAAQAAIAGAVKDSTGAALPGVRVEASSPALIERMRTVVTDGAGQYRIVDLSPGLYDVTFTIPGFTILRRTGILLEGNFTAPVNAELAPGVLTEAVTVTGESPVVDVVSNRTTVVVNRDMLDAIPTATRSLQARANLIPGTTVTPVGSGQTSMTIYGSQAADQVVMVDGMRLNLLEGQGQFSGIYLNDGMAQEISYDTGAQNAEVAQGGLRVNMIPREGGNTFSGIFFIQGVNGPLATDNRSDAVRAFIPQPLGLAYTYEINPSFGGPIKRDKLWFYFTYKLSDTKSYVTLPDRSQGAQQNWPNYSYVTRLTWQVSKKDKFRVYIDKQMNGQKYEGLGANTTPEASHQLWTPRGMTPQVKWTQTTTNKLMLEAGMSMYDLNFRREPQPGVLTTNLPKFETSTGVNSGSYAGTMDSWTTNYTTMASASYVTGSHSFKTGMNHGWGRRIRTWPSPNPANILQLRFTDSQPAQVQVRNTPIDESIERMNADLGVFVQDAWTMKKLTLNVGARYDYFNAEVPALSAPASTWVPARARSAVKNVPNWHDVTVRLAAAYDLFGDGRTALKVNASKYVASAALGFAETFNTLTAATETRTWNDADGNRSVLDANGNLQRNEVLGGTANFGSASGTDRPDPNLEREYNWEYNASVQHELFPRISIAGGYHRRTFGNLAVIDNQNLSPSDWTQFTIMAPADDRLPGSGGFPITLYTLNTNKVGIATDNLRTFSTSNSRVYNGLDLTINARIGDTAFLLGGVTADKLATDNCDGSTAAAGSARDNPNISRFCAPAAPFRTIFKLAGSYELPYDIQLAGSFTMRPGGDISATYTVTSAIAGRPIIGSTAGAAQISVNLIEPNTMFREYINQLDLRVAKTFRIDRYRLQALVDIYNLFNAGTVATLNTTFGANPATRVWLNPQTLQTSRYVRFGAQLRF